MLAEVLADAGLRTGAFTGGGFVAAEFGFNRGFSVYMDGVDNSGFARSFPRAEAWLRARQDAPFFLFLHSYDVHGPYDPPPPYDQRYFPDYRGTVQPNRTVPLINMHQRRGAYEDFEGPIDLSDADRAEIVALYDGEIAYADSFLGRLVMLLDELGELDRTLLVVIADHGEEFWDHSSMGHGHTLYQELIHVPLLMRFPGRRFAGNRPSARVRLIDVAPTILDALGLPPEASFEGRSLMPLLRGEDFETLPAASESEGHISIIDDPWKLIVERSSGNVSLFNLTRDPGESQSLAALFPEVTGRLLARLDGIGSAEETPTHPIINGRLLQQLRALGYLR
jgi:arylsulfatase A-like enzyme